MPASFVAISIAFGVTAAAATVQGTIGLGLAVLSVPILAIVDPDLVPVPQLLVSFALTVPMAWRERSAIDLSGAGWILWGRIPGALVGLLVLATAPRETLGVVIGGIVLAVVVLLAAGLDVPRNRTTSLTAGVVSGVTSMVASIGGPPVALLYRSAPGNVVRSTLASVFAIGIVVTLVTRLIAGRVTGDDVKVAVVLLPAVVIGLAASRHLANWIEGPRLRMAVLMVSGAAAVTLIVRNLG